MTNISSDKFQVSKSQKGNAYILEKRYSSIEPKANKTQLHVDDKTDELISIRMRPTRRLERQAEEDKDSKEELYDRLYDIWQSSKERARFGPKGRLQLKKLNQNLFKAIARNDINLGTTSQKLLLLPNSSGKKAKGSSLRIPHLKSLIAKALGKASPTSVGGNISLTLLWSSAKMPLRLPQSIHIYELPENATNLKLAGIGRGDSAKTAKFTLHNARLDHLQPLLRNSSQRIDDISTIKIHPRQHRRIPYKAPSNSNRTTAGYKQKRASKKAHKHKQWRQNAAKYAKPRAKVKQNGKPKLRKSNKQDFGQAAMHKAPFLEDDLMSDLSLIEYDPIYNGHLYYLNRTI